MLSIHAKEPPIINLTVHGSMAATSHGLNRLAVTVQQGAHPPATPCPPVCRDILQGPCCHPLRGGRPGVVRGQGAAGAGAWGVMGVRWGEGFEGSAVAGCCRCMLPYRSDLLSAEQKGGGGLQQQWGRPKAGRSGCRCVLQGSKAPTVEQHTLALPLPIPRPALLMRFGSSCTLQTSKDGAGAQPPVLPATISLSSSCHSRPFAPSPPCGP